jgi:signal transduction histidine kinase
LALLLVITFVAIFTVWITQLDFKPNVDIVRFVVYFDLLLETLIGVAIILLGQAIVSYEIFTGHVLPRRGFFRQWRGTVLFAWGTAWVVGFALNWNIQSIFSFVFTTTVMMILYAFFGWRTFKHREELIAQLHPFMANHPTTGLPGIVYLDQQALTLFTAICREVLDTTQAYLIPLGTRAPLVGPPLAYPPSATPPTLRITPELFPDTLIVALDAASYAGATWGIPLWAGQGLIGALLLGPKRNDAVYTREEIEIARMSAERILDTLAGEQIAQRLVQIERRRLAETKVLDLRTRRALHDEILPELHMIALHLSPSARTDPTVNQAIQSLSQIHHQISDLIHTSTGIFASGSHSVSFIRALQDGINEEYADAFDSITWQFPQESFELDPLLREVVMNAIREIVRNAALHGRGNQPERKLHLTLQIRCEATKLIIEVQDDGVGMTFGPRRADGGGSGLMLHSTLLAISGGELSIESPASGGTHIVISAPIQ